MSKSSKDVNYKNSNPGVGEYEVDKKPTKNQPKYSIGHSKRNDLVINPNIKYTNSPGPGRYSLTPVIGNGPKATMGNKWKDMSGLRTPGPGAYDNEKKLNLMKTCPGWKMGFSTRSNNPFNANETSSKFKTPGPGDYNLERKQNSGYKFSQDPKLKRVKSGTPGPGHYKIPCSVVDVPRYLGGQFEEQYKYV